MIMKAGGDDARSVSRADIHIHSKYSDRPSEWFLRRIGAPESYIEPEALYASCRERGMDYVTIADHNSIRGALEIAHLPGVFLSSEITTYFPEDNCKVHCLVSGITEKSFAEIQQIRTNIYDLQKYLAENNIIHTIAHPLFRVNDRLTADHFEKLLLLFKSFEVINGSRHIRAGSITRTILDSLTPALIEKLADHHGIEPTGPEPWKKNMLAGSDDHGGLYVASAYTETPYASNVFDFLQHLREGSVTPAGRGGSSVRLAHSLYKIAYSYYSSCLMDSNSTQNSLVEGLLAKLADKRKEEEKTGLQAAMVRRFRRFAYRYREKNVGFVEGSLVSEISAIFDDSSAHPIEDGSDIGNSDNPEDRRRFLLACRISQQLSFKFLERFMRTIKEGQIIESMQSLFSIAPVVMGISPYLTAYGAQHKDEALLKEVAGRFPAAVHLREKTGRRAWITDTFNEVNGVAHTIDRMSEIANERGEPITVITCNDNCREVSYPLRNFKPVGKYRLPEYESIDTVIPPFLEILAYIEEQEFDELIISTPGTLGCCGLMAGRLLGLKMSGIYHTDFPKFVQNLTDDDSLEDLSWKYMKWFYGNMDMIFLPSNYYREQLIDNGFVPERLAILPKGVDLDLFNPKRRNKEFWQRYGVNGGFKFIYVGRVSKEKNIEAMLDAYLGISDGDGDIQLVVVGDGPELEDLKKKYKRKDIIFTGYLHGAELAEAYASSDVFVFPSMTDTFGNAVLEAHACGLPALVADRGGPPEIVRSHKSGLVVDARKPVEIQNAMLRMIEDRSLRQQLTEGALMKARESRWETALDFLAR